MSIYIGPSGRRRPAMAPPPDPTTEAAGSREHARAIATGAWSPPTVEAYMEADWFVFERADLPDPEARR